MTKATTDATDQRAPGSFTKTLTIAASPDALCEAVTTVEGIRRWWSNETVEDGDGITVRFSDGIFTTLRLVDLVPDRPAAWAFTAQHFPVEGTSDTAEWVGTRAVFDIRANPDGTATLVFTHAGLTPRLACYNLCNEGWDFALTSLKGYLEHGTGRPFRPGI